MCKISVIIPVYNTEEFLNDCINSVIQQTYDKIEILLINDDSNQSTRTSLESWQKSDHRIKIIHNPEKKGVGYSRNKGIEYSSGKYLYFLDSDDFIDPNTLQILIKNIGEHKIISGNIKKTTMSYQDELEKQLKDEQNIQTKMVHSLHLFSDRTVLNRLIDKEFIIDNQLRFNENLNNFSELSFILPICTKVVELPYCSNTPYFKRLRNDPISNPSLSQSDPKQRIMDFLTSYLSLKSLFKDQIEASRYLDELFANFYQRSIRNYLANGGELGAIFPSLSLAAKSLEQKVINSKRYVVRREINTLAKGNCKRFATLNTIHRRIAVLKTALSGRTKLYLSLYRYVFCNLPIKENKIVLESFLGKNYSDSPKYIYEYMVKEKMDFQYIWIFNEPGKKIPGNAKQIRRFSLKYYYHLATAKYWVSNSRLPKHLLKRKGNIYLQTWHGTPLKQLVFDMKDVHSANPNYKLDFYKQSRRWDYLISPNQYSSDIFRSAFKYEKEMLEFGYPRNDILHSDDKYEIASNIKKRLGIAEDKKVILYAPTWRDDEFYGRGKYKFQLQLDLEMLQKQLGSQYVIVLRMHYFIANQLDLSKYKGFAYDCSNYDDIADLYLISDLLITDYSSVFFDFANLRRPILFFTYDLEKYRDTLRGFYFDLEEEAPGPLLKTTDQVIKSIINLEQVNESYAEKYKKFYEKFCSWENGRATEKVVSRVFTKD